MAPLVPVSIVITNYNYERFVGAAIESALDQGPGVEVVVVDDGSTDDSSRILARYHGRVRLVLQDNGGQGSAFNAGFEAATGELILLLDADDVLLAGSVVRVREAAAADHLERMEKHDRPGIG
ncbi:MAG: glycosyltransferase, partial [Actinomycetota bacterium]